MYAAVVGLLFLNALQFTTTAFLATQSGLVLGLFAFMQAAKGESRSAHRYGAAGTAFLLLAALIRWHVFLMFFSLAIPAACMLAWSYRRQTRLLVTAGGLVTSTLVVLVGLSWLNDAYYERDPRWSDFYSFNELRARINDLAWVYYSPETAHVFPKVGWSVNDYAMIQSWFYDDQAVYNAEKFQELLDAYPWTESDRGGNGVTDLLSALAGDPHVLPLLALIAFMAMMLGHNKEGQTALLLTCLWVGGMLCVITVLRKPPPPRVYLPMLAFPAALALTLGAALRGSAARKRGPRVAVEGIDSSIYIPKKAVCHNASGDTRRMCCVGCVWRSEQSESANRPSIARLRTKPETPSGVSHACIAARQAVRRLGDQHSVRGAQSVGQPAEFIQPSHAAARLDATVRVSCGYEKPLRRYRLTARSVESSGHRADLRPGLSSADGRLYPPASRNRPSVCTNRTVRQRGDVSRAKRRATRCYRDAFNSAVKGGLAWKRA